MKRFSVAVFAVAIVTLFAVGPAVAETATWKADPVHSSVMFRIKHLDTAYVYGMFETTTGSVQFDPENLENSSFDIAIKAESIYTGNKKRDTHLRSADFFDVEKHPEIRFKSTTVKKVEQKTMTVTGDLTLRGQTRPITVQIHFTGQGKNPMDGSNRAGFETGFQIKRSDYGMNWGLDNNMLSDEVTLMVALETIKQ